MRKGERGMETVRMCTQRQVQGVLQKWDHGATACSCRPQRQLPRHCGLAVV